MSELRKQIYCRNGYRKVSAGCANLTPLKFGSNRIARRPTVADATGARRAIEWFLGNNHEEPSDGDLLDLHCFLRNLMAQIDAGEELNLAEWETMRRTYASDRSRALN